MRNFNALDPSALRAFYYAAHFLHFTRAAAAAGLTQSGVSQHMSRLERELGAPLFYRNGRKVALTESGKELLRYADRCLDELEGLRENLRRSRRELRGLVRYAMPDSCLYTPHFPLLLDQRAATFPNVQLRVEILPSEQVIERLRAREIDFGFVSKAFAYPDVALSAFATEEYLLVGARKELVDVSSPAEVLALPFINYPGMEDLFALWFRERFPHRRMPPFLELKVEAEINSLKGALILAEKGAGSTFVQRHCAEEALTSRRLIAARESAENRIYLATHHTEDPPARVRAVIAAFSAMKKSGKEAISKLEFQKK